MAAVARDALVNANEAERWTVTVVVALIAVIGVEPDVLWWEWGPVEVRWGQALGLVVVGAAVADRFLQRDGTPLRGGVGVISMLTLHAGWVAASWLAADQFSQNVGASTFRLVLAPVIGVAVWSVVRTRGERRRLLVWVVNVGSLAAVVGVLAVANGGEWWFTDLLRGAPTALGPYERLTRPFNHTNVAAMVFAPLAVLAIGLSATRRSWWPAAIVLQIATILTYSRMAPVALLAGIVVAAALSRSRAAWQRGGVLVIVLVGLAVVLSPAWSARLASPGRTAWYGVAIGVGEPFASDGSVEVQILNRSTVAWTAEGSDRVEVSLRWRSPDNGLEYLDERFPLDTTLLAGEALVQTVASSGHRLPIGEYEVLVDVVRDQDAFFGETTGGAAVLTVVGGTAGAEAAPRPVRRPIPEMARTDLWRAAIGLASHHPLFGVGTGNFRLLYGPELDLDVFPRGSHAHSLYLEPAASSGIPAALFLVAAIVLVGGRAAKLVGRLDGPEAAIVGAAATMAVHGIVDWPLIFTASGVLFFVLLVLAAQVTSTEVLPAAELGAST